jgi:hypothetical protein
MVASAAGAGAAFQDERAAEDVVAAALVLPPAQVAPPAGYDNDEAFAKWVESEGERLTAEAQKAESGLVRAERLIEAANHLLAYGLVHDATSQVLGMKEAPAPKPPEGAEPVASGERQAPVSGSSAAIHDRVKAALSDAAIALSDANEDPAAARLRMRLHTLEAFSMALRAALTSEGDSEEIRRSAASALAPLSEDPDEAVAAAAGLWQAVLRARESDAAPALSILPMATADPKAGRKIYEFFGKLLRCRLVGRQSPGAALTLLLQMEEQCHKWFEGAAERALAIRGTAWVRMTVLEDWCEKLDQPDMRSWCAKSAEELSTEHFAGEKAVLPLSPAVPILKAVAENSDEPEEEDTDGAQDED